MQLLMNLRALAGVAGLTLALATAAGAQSARTDDQIENDIESRVADSPALSGQAIGIWTHDGVVTLSGQVRDDGSRRAAVEIAQRVEGVRSVEDHLHLPGEPAPTEGGEAQQQAPAETQQEAEVQQPMPEPQQQQAPDQGQYPAPEQPPQQAQQQEQQAPPPEPPQVRRDAPAYPSPPPPPSTRYPDRYPDRYSERYPQRARYPESQTRLQSPLAPVTLPAGTTLSVRLETDLDTHQTQPGTVFRAYTAQNVFVRGYVTIPRGTLVEGTVVDVQNSGDFKGSAKIALQLDRILLDQRAYEVRTNLWNTKGPGKGGQTIGSTIGGAAVGAVIGGAVGGGVGAAIGAGVGGAAGAGVSGAVPSGKVVLPRETVLTFSLQEPLTIEPISQEELDRMVAQQHDERENAPRGPYGRYPYPPPPPPPRYYPYPPPPPPPPYYYYRPYYRPYYPYRYW